MKRLFHRTFSVLGLVMILMITMPSFPAAADWTNYAANFQQNDGGFQSKQPWGLSNGELTFGGGVEQYYDNLFPQIIGPDFQYEAKVHWTGGAEDQGFGLLFRYLDPDDFISMEITGDGYYQVNKIIGGVGFELVPWKRSTLIHLKEYNDLKVICAGTTVKCYINNVLAVTAYDPDLGQDQGTAGFTSGGGVQCTFDNFTIRELSDKEKYGVTPEAPVRITNFTVAPGGFGLSKGWQINGAELIFNRGVNGTYHVNIPNDDFEREMSVAVTTRWIGGDGDGIGLVFRYVDRDNLYNFQINSEGMFRVGKLVKGRWIDIMGWTSSNQILSGSNRLKVICANKKITCYVNDREVATIEDELAGKGYVSAGVNVSGNVQCAFRDFEVVETLNPYLFEN